MEAAISVAVVLAYVILLTFVALRARTAHEFEEFSLAKRSLPLALVFGSLAATYVGPGFTIGFVGKGFNSGFLFLQTQFDQLTATSAMQVGPEITFLTLTLEGGNHFAIDYDSSDIGISRFRNEFLH